MATLHAKLALPASAAPDGPAQPESAHDTGSVKSQSSRKLKAAVLAGALTVSESWPLAINRER